MDLSMGREVLNDYAAASGREWLATNGIGGYASGSLAGANTRRYHGLLVAALTPPTGRMVALSRVEETLTVAGAAFELAANQYPGALHPQGYRFLERFDPWPAPAFHYRPRPDVLLRKRVWMARGQNTTFVEYTLIESPEAATLRLSLLACWKDYHHEMRAWDGFPASLEAAPGEARLRPVPGAPALRLLLPGAAWEPAGYWHFNVEHARERERGLDWREDLYCPGHFLLALKPGESAILTATLEDVPATPQASWETLLRRQEDLHRRAAPADDFAAALALAADAFVIEAADAGRLPARSTLLAGYHWFTDWGRDTMIALPGLCLATGRPEVARDILASFAEFVSEGMLPNRFPDHGETPEYNTADATLWYFQAAWEYAQSASREEAVRLLRPLWPVLADIVAWHVRGTRYGIGVDPADGLLRAGQPGVQLTWMDAKVGDWVVTPRSGKPVEIDALWYNALRVMEQAAALLGQDPAPFAARARHVARRFRAVFVRPDGNGLYDVLTDNGPGAALRPNQVLAVSLPYSPLTKREQKAVVQAVERDLLTPFGLRTLAPSDPAYRPRYGGGPWERDGAYHQGTVWAWLLGPFALAHYRVFGDRERARGFLRPLQSQLLEAGIGHLSEIFDGDPPHAPNGCIAQAWSVAETLRAWKVLDAGHAPG